MLIINSTERNWIFSPGGAVGRLIPKSIAPKRYQALAILDDDSGGPTIGSVMAQGWTPKYLAADSQGRPCQYDHIDAAMWSLAGAFLKAYTGRGSMQVAVARLMVEWVADMRGSLYEDDARGILKLSMNMCYEDQVTMIEELRI